LAACRRGATTGDVGLSARAICQNLDDPTPVLTELGGVKVVHDLSLANGFRSLERHMALRKTAIVLALLSSMAPLRLSAQGDGALSGDVASVDLTAGTITISHEPNDRLGLGRSTDKFRVSEPIMLNAIRPGAHIRFAADRVNGELAITKIFTD
jgi:Cu(I)/Ag(I) efflux system periplasmic protein CusF